MTKSTIPKSASSKLLAATKNVNSQSRPQSQAPDFVRLTLLIPDVQIANAFIEEQAGLEFDGDDGKDIEYLKYMQDYFDERYKTSLARLKELESRRNNTNPHRKSALYGDGETKRKSFLAWKFPDQFSITLLYTSLIAVLVMGANNIYINLMESGKAVFLENPWTAISLSMLMPAGSAALKFIPSYFENPKAKKRYALFLYCLTALLLVLWSVFFAQSFSGASSGIDWDSLGEESSGKGSILVFLQIAAEIAVAGSLFMAAEDIHTKYTPDIQVADQAFIASQDAFKSHEKEFDEVNEKRGRNHAQIIALEKRRQKNINLALMTHAAIRSKREALDNL